MICLKLNKCVLHMLYYSWFPFQFPIQTYLHCLLGSYSNCPELSKSWFLANSISICQVSQGLHCLEPLLLQCWWLATWTWKYGQNREPLHLTLFYEYMHWQICNQFWGNLLLLKVSHTFLCQWSLRAKPDYCWVQWECDLKSPLNLCVGSSTGLS